MTKVESLDALKQMRERLRSDMNIRENSNHPEDLPQIRISMGTCGIAAGAKEVMLSLIHIYIPRGFSIKGRSGEDFLWVGNDVRTATQGLVRYSYPYAGAEDFAPENLIKRRNEFTGRIPGPSEGAFMATEDYIRPEVEYSRIDGKLWARMSGFWYVENDYMGGPFINYSTIDPATGRVFSCLLYTSIEVNTTLW